MFSSKTSEVKLYVLDSNLAVKWRVRIDIESAVKEKERREDAPEYHGC
jgi:hypothetical protein